MTDPLAVARRLADEVLFPAAERVEASGVVPRTQLDLIAQSGLYGLFREPPGPAAYRVVEALASGCLATAFVWLQHHSAVRMVMSADSALKSASSGAASQQPGVPATWLDRLVSGETRAGVALGGLRPGPPRLRSVPGGYELTGEAPWVTGWGLVDVLLVAARDADDVATWLLLDAQPSATLTIEALELLAVNASRTVHIRLHRHWVPADRLVGTLPFAAWPERDAAGLRGNGSLALGLADRCRRLLVGLVDDRPSGLDGTLEFDAALDLDAALDAARAELDAAGPAELPAARAGASALAIRAATTLVTATGARAALTGDTAGRLLREAAFLLVFGSRPAIRAELLRRLAR